MALITFIEAVSGQPFTKEFSQENGVQSYRNAAFLNSYNESVQTPDELCTALKTHARMGHAMLKGVLEAPLENERRAGKVARTQPTNILVLDLDGVTEIENIEAFIESVPELNHTDYVVQLSASMGITFNGLPIKRGLHAHVFFLQGFEATPQQQKKFIYKLNFDNETLKRQLHLNENNSVLRFVLDPCVANPASPIYIAPAVVSSPYADILTLDQRIYVVEKGNPHIINRHIFAGISDEWINQKKDEHRKKLRHDRGLEGKRAKKFNTTTIQPETGGPVFELLQNPDRGTLHFIGEARGFCYYNLNDGDSCAYYHPSNDPNIIYNFKEEPCFRHVDVDPESFREAVERVAPNAEIAERFVFREQFSDRFYGVAYSREKDRLEYCAPMQKENLAGHLQNYGLDLPDPIPDWTMEFDPTSSEVIDYGRQWLNSFVESPYIKSAIPFGESIEFDDILDYLHASCPHIAAITQHVVGNDDEGARRLLNWFGHILQNRTKPNTAWVLHGVQGTGKNLLIEHVFAPLLGENATQMKPFSQMTDQFNGWLPTTRLLCLNETRMRDLTGAQGKVMQMLKMMITESEMSVRAMRQEARMVKNHTALIFFSNYDDAMVIEDYDRRFHIAPPQKVRLLKVCELLIPEDWERLCEVINQELPTFTSIMLALKVDANKVFLAWENEAKIAMKEAARTSVEEFVDIIKTADLDRVFEFIGDLSLPHTPSKVALDNMTALRYNLAKWVANVGRPLNISSAELANLYAAATTSDKDTMNGIRFSKMLARNGIILKPGLRHENSRQTFRGLKDHVWKLNKMTVEDALAILKDLGVNLENMGDAVDWVRSYASAEVDLEKKLGIETSRLQ